MTGTFSEQSRGEAEFREPSRPWPVIIDDSSGHRRPGPPGASPQDEARHGRILKKRGRPPKRWRIHVFRIDAAKYPQFLRDRDHPFMAMSVPDRNHEIDSFLACLRARARKGRTGGRGRDRLAA